MKLSTHPFLAAAAVALLAALPVARAEEAQAPREGVACRDHAAVVGLLESRLGQTPVGIGRQLNGTVLEIFASAKTGTWTIVVTLPITDEKGLSCLIAAGEKWRSGMHPAVDPLPKETL